MRTASVAVLAAALSFGAVAPVLADGVFGAIAFSQSTGKVGWSHDYPAEADASQEAIAQCGVEDCAAVATVAICGAVAVGDGYGMGYSVDESVAKSEETALAKCDGFTTNCLIVGSFCNGS